MEQSVLENESVIFMLIYLFTYLLNNVPEKQDRNIEIRYTYQCLKFKTGIGKLLESNNINHNILLIYRAFSAD